MLKEARITWQKAQEKYSRKSPEIVQQINPEIREIIQALLPEIEAKKVVVYTIDESHLLEGNLIIATARVVKSLIGVERH